MKIHEFQAKDVLRKAGVILPAGKIARHADEAEQAARELGGKVVVKAQIHAGGRGKGTLVKNADIRGVKVVDSPQAAKTHAAALLGNALHTHQTGPEGQIVKTVLLEPACSIAKELYLGITLDRDQSKISFIASQAGGMDIEAVAAETPEKILKMAIEPTVGMLPFYGRKLAYSLGLKGDLAKQATKLFAQLYEVFVGTDASLLEINPLVVTSDDKLIPLDAKMTFDENALFRHPEIMALRDADEEDAKERAAKDANLSYVSLDGNIGCLVNGAGLAMATMDIIKHVGGSPANFLDVGGGATADQVTKAFKIILSDKNVRAILINIFGGIAKCDVIAEGVVTAARDVGLKLPLVVRLEGTNVEKGKKILNDSGLAITPANDMLDAAKKAVAAAGGKS